MADVFVSYKSEDRELVAPLVGCLQAKGDLSIWWDTRIQAGAHWDSEIERELHLAQCVVVVWSPSSVNSHWVRTEANFARSKGILVPVSILGVEPPVIYNLIQTVDLTRWKGDCGDPAIQKLLSRVRSVVAGERLDAVLRGQAPSELQPARRRTFSRGTILGLIVIATLASSGSLAYVLLAPQKPPDRKALLLAEKANSPVNAAMVWIEAGRSEIRPGTIVYTDSFLIDQYEVTVADFRKFVQSEGYDYAIDSHRQCNFDKVDRDDHPMNCVSWHDVEAFARWAGKQLPTEAEWLRAASGRTLRPIQAAALGRDMTTAVGEVAEDASSAGARDMLGNVSEWGADWYAPDGPADGARNPRGPSSGTEKLLLGSWFEDPADSRIDKRRRDIPTAGRFRPDYGFRLVLREVKR